MEPDEGSSRSPRPAPSDSAAGLAIDRPSPSLLMIGASVRAAARSARRAGFIPIGIDLFADRDLAALGPACRIAGDSYPRGFASLLAPLPPGPFLYTGGLENHPDVLDEIALERPLWGIHGEVLRALRDPFLVREILLKREIPCPDAQPDFSNLPADGSWLVKPRRSAGGTGIVPWRGASPLPDADHFPQRRVTGTPIAAIYLGRGGDAIPLGVTRQRIGRPDAPFSYTGSVGPIPLSPPIRRRVRHLGDALTEAFGLLGLFGVDCVLDEDGVPWPVEINPRYTASVEVLELATGRAFLAEHAAIFGCAVETRSRKHRDGCVGKAILFADHPCRFPADCGWKPEHRQPDDWAAIGDVPDPRQTFAPGHPVLTVFAWDRTPESCETKLISALARWRRRLIPA